MSDWIYRTFKNIWDDSRCYELLDTVLGININRSTLFLIKSL